MTIGNEFVESRVIYEEQSHMKIYPDFDSYRLFYAKIETYELPK